MDGRLLREIRKNSGITQMQVMVATGINDARLSQIENGIPATVAEIEKISAFIQQEVGRRLKKLSELLQTTPSMASLAVDESGKAGLSIDDASMRRSPSERAVLDGFRKVHEAGGTHVSNSDHPLRRGR